VTCPTRIRLRNSVLRITCVEFSRSAFKQGFSVDEIAHAVATAVVVIDLDAIHAMSLRKMFYEFL